jgi:hypothetical protein
MGNGGLAKNVFSHKDHALSLPIPVVAGAGLGKGFSGPPWIRPWRLRAKHPVLRAPEIPFPTPSPRDKQYSFG